MHELLEGFIQEYFSDCIEYSGEYGALLAGRRGPLRNQAIAKDHFNSAATTPFNSLQMYNLNYP